MKDEEKVEIIKPEDRKDIHEKKQEKNTKGKEKNKIIDKYAKYISPILMGLVGFVLITNSNDVIIYAFYIIGALIAGFGVYNFMQYYQIKKEMQIEDSEKLTLAIVCIAIGLLVVFLSSFIQTFLNLIIGLWLILTGTVRLLNINELSGNAKKMTMGISAIYILMGLYSIMVQNIFVTIIGIWMVIGSCLELYKILRKK